MKTGIDGTKRTEEKIKNEETYLSFILALETTLPTSRTPLLN